MRISTVANWLAALCALVASVVCYQLVLRHVTGLSGPAWFELECSDKPGSAAAGCTEVLASPYSYFPPKLGKNVPAGLPHIPVAFIGLMYYSTLLAWLVGVGRPAYAKRGLHYAAFLLVALGLGGSAYFVWIMSRVISEWCPWCVFTHVLNLLIFICMVFMWPKRRALGGEKTAPEGSAAGDAAERTGGVVHPSARVLMKVPPIWWTGKAQISEKELQTCLQPIAPMTRTSIRKRSIFCSAADVRSSGWPQNSVLPPILYGPGGTGPSARGA